MSNNEKFERPWGWYETISLGDNYQAKRIYVKPGGKLSLQSHKHRAEHWVIVSGTAKVTLSEEELILKTNQSVYIEKEQKHRLENTTTEDLYVIEVQTGNYLGEDDIIRYEDIYNRS